MVQLYNQRLEEARLELAGNIRKKLIQLMEEKCPYLGISLRSEGYHYIKDGHLYTMISTGPSYSERREIKPDELPLEEYSSSFLLIVARNINLV